MPCHSYRHLTVARQFNRRCMIVDVHKQTSCEWSMHSQTPSRALAKMMSTSMTVKARVTSRVSLQSLKNLAPSMSAKACRLPKDAKSMKTFRRSSAARCTQDRCSTGIHFMSQLALGCDMLAELVDLLRSRIGSQGDSIYFDHSSLYS